MKTNERGPVVVFAVLFGAIFLCLCLVVAAAGLSNLGQSIAANPAEMIGQLPTPTPLVVQAPAETLDQEAPTLDITTGDSPARPPVVIEIDPNEDVETQILRAVYQKVNPSVVKVISLGDAAIEAFGDDPLPQGQGSGFIWDDEGFIVTNAHVVQDADQVQIIFYDDRTVTGEVLGADANSDLAVIEIDPTELGLVAVERGNLDEIAVGDRAIAIGAPFDFAGSMTVGTVSGLGRSIRSLNVRYTIPEVIQTDAAINPGNSGGPLLDARGQVIGINAQIRTEGNVRANSGVGFAIPIYIAERVVPKLIEMGRYEHPFIGISGQTYSPEWSEALGFPPDVRGAYVSEALSGFPAADAGIRGGNQDTDIVTGVDIRTGQPAYLQAGGDLILGINDQPVARFDDLLIYLFRYASPGDVVQLTVLRENGSETVIPVELSVRPNQ
jgi:2-alkenal reductase